MINYELQCTFFKEKNAYINNFIVLHAQIHCSCVCVFLLIYLYKLTLFLKKNAQKYILFHKALNAQFFFVNKKIVDIIYLKPCCTMRKKKDWHFSNQHFHKKS